MICVAFCRRRWSGREVGRLLQRVGHLCFLIRTPRHPGHHAAADRAPALCIADPVFQDPVEQRPPFLLRPVGIPPGQAGSWRPAPRRGRPLRDAVRPAPCDTPCVRLLPGSRSVRGWSGLSMPSKPGLRDPQGLRYYNARLAIRLTYVQFVPGPRAGRYGIQRAGAAAVDSGLVNARGACCVTDLNQGRVERTCARA